jgi:hypothetical protein
VYRNHIREIERVSATFTIDARPTILGGVCEHGSGTWKNIWRKTPGA